jgi:hypothetical protein
MTTHDEGGTRLSDQRFMALGAPQKLDPRQIEQFKEIIIRAHYLSMEIRDLCAPSAVAPIEISLGASRVLRAWALAFSQALETAVRTADSS